MCSQIAASEMLTVKFCDGVVGCTSISDYALAAAYIARLEISIEIFTFRGARESVRDRFYDFIICILHSSSYELKCS